MKKGDLTSPKSIQRSLCGLNESRDRTNRTFVISLFAEERSINNRTFYIAVSCCKNLGAQKLGSLRCCMFRSYPRKKRRYAKNIDLSPRTLMSSFIKRRATSHAGFELPVSVVPERSNLV